MKTTSFLLRDLGNNGYAYAKRMHEIGLLVSKSYSLSAIVALLESIQPDRRKWFIQDGFNEDLYSALNEDFGYNISL